MNAAKIREMEETYQSYEFFIREKLEALDFLSRKMFAEIGIFGVPKSISVPYVQEEMRKLARSVVMKGDKAVVKHRKLRTIKRQS